MLDTTMMERVFSEAIWENYYTLSATPIDAMANIWDDYQEGYLLSWALGVGLTEDSLLNILATLTQNMRTMDLTKTAMGLIL